MSNGISDSYRECFYLMEFVAYKMFNRTQNLERSEVTTLKTLSREDVAISLSLQ